METDIGDLERQVLQMLLDGEDPVLAVLRRQLVNATRGPIKFTGVGFFADYRLPDCAPHIDGNPSFSIGDVFAEIEGLRFGAGFILFIANGQLTTLEAFTYEEPWPQGVLRFELKYMTEKARDISALHARRGWPNATVPE